MPTVHPLLRCQRRVRQAATTGIGDSAGFTVTQQPGEIFSSTQAQSIICERMVVGLCSMCRPWNKHLNTYIFDETEGAHTQELAQQMAELVLRCELESCWWGGER